MYCYRLETRRDRRNMMISTWVLGVFLNRGLKAALLLGCASVTQRTRSLTRQGRDGACSKVHSCTMHEYLSMRCLGQCPRIEVTWELGYRMILASIKCLIKENWKPNVLHLQSTVSIISIEALWYGWHLRGVPTYPKWYNLLITDTTLRGTTLLK